MSYSKPYVYGKSILRLVCCFPAGVTKRESKNNAPAKSASPSAHNDRNPMGSPTLRIRSSVRPRVAASFALVSIDWGWRRGLVLTEKPSEPRAFHRFPPSLCPQGTHTHSTTRYVFVSQCRTVWARVARTCTETSCSYAATVAIPRRAPTSARWVSRTDAARVAARGPSLARRVHRPHRGRRSRTIIGRGACVRAVRGRWRRRCWKPVWKRFAPPPLGRPLDRRRRGSLLKWSTPYRVRGKYVAARRLLRINKSQVDFIGGFSLRPNVFPLRFSPDDNNRGFIYLFFVQSPAFLSDGYCLPKTSENVIVFLNVCAQQTTQLFTTNVYYFFFTNLVTSHNNDR